MAQEHPSALSQENTTAQAGNDGSDVIRSPFCRDLRSKRYYFLQEMPTEEHHFLDASRQCWCRRTMQAIGPDGERAIPRSCKPERDCYRSRFDEA